MSKKQRRDHRPEPAIDYRPHPNGRGGTIVGDVECKTCGKPLCSVYDRSLPVKSRTYWRHRRRR